MTDQCDARLYMVHQLNCFGSAHTAIFVFKKKMQSHFKCSQLKYLLLFNLLKENPDYESTYVFENDFPALLQDEAPSPGMLFLF